MIDNEHLFEVIRSLGASLDGGGVVPAQWREVGEALNRLPEVRGVLFALWLDANAPALLSLGELADTPEVLAAALRSLPEGTTRMDLGGMCVLAAPLGRPEMRQGVLALTVHAPDDGLRALVTALAAVLSASLHLRQLARENQRLENAVHEQMSRMGELAAVGQLAASVAHELRNPLSSIKGAAQYLCGEYQDLPTLHEFLNIILEEVNVLSRITTEFLDFARPMHLELQEAHIHENIRKLLQVMKPQLAAQNIEPILDLGPEVPATVFDAPQIDHVLRNIVTNAVQAMPEGGALMVRTRYRITPFPGVEIAISDTGRGISPEDMGNLFTPFFTTKTKGVGLGLTIVQKIVRNHGGTVSVESVLGKGSTFTVSLPRAPGPENLRLN